MTDAAGVARVWQSLVDVLPKRVHPGGLDRLARCASTGDFPAINN
jgi:hypothetical protein